MTAGTNLIKFNSSPNQAIGQDIDEITITVPVTTPNNISLTKIKIKPIVKSYTPKLYQSV